MIVCLFAVFFLCLFAVFAYFVLKMSVAHVVYVLSDGSLANQFFLCLFMVCLFACLQFSFCYTKTNMINLHACSLFGLWWLVCRVCLFVCFFLVFVIVFYQDGLHACSLFGLWWQPLANYTLADHRLSPRIMIFLHLVFERTLQEFLNYIFAKLVQWFT